MRRRIPVLRPYVSPESIDLAVKTLSSNWIGGGPVVKQFESRVCEMIGNGLFVALNSCSSSLNIAYELAQISDGDEVVTTPLTCLATNIPILARRAKPIWADVGLDGTLDPKSVATKITEKTKAIVAVHLSGQPCDLDALGKISCHCGIPVIEDAAQAFGARFQGLPVGSHSDFVCFSFQAVKIITAVDGGGIALKSRHHFEICRKKRWFGIDRDNRTPGDTAVGDIGYRYEMNDVMASVGLGNLLHMSELQSHRKELATTYVKHLAKIPDLVLPFDLNGPKSPSLSLFPVLARNRDGLQRKLNDYGVESSPLQYRNDMVELFHEFGGCDLPMVDRWSREMLYLPIGHWVSCADAEYISEVIEAGW